MVHLSIDEITEGIALVFRPQLFQESAPPSHESEEELLERRDSRITAKPEPLESETVTEIPIDELVANRRFPAVGVDEGLWRMVLGTHDIIISNAGWISTWPDCARWSKEVARDWAIMVRNRDILNPHLPSSLRKRVYLLSTHGPVEEQVDKLTSAFMQMQLRSAIQSAMNLHIIQIDEIDGALRAHSHKDIDDLSNMYRFVHKQTERLAVFIVKRPLMQTVVRNFGLEYSDDRAFYVSKMMQKRKNPANYMRSHWIRECDPHVTKDNQVTFCWILTPRNLAFRIETFYWMFKEHQTEITSLVASDSYQNGAGFFPLHQTMAHEQFSISYGFREMLRAKLAYYMRLVSPESRPWEAYGWGM